jgi:hypothetical protein
MQLCLGYAQQPVLAQVNIKNARHYKSKHIDLPEHLTIIDKDFCLRA